MAGCHDKAMDLLARRAHFRRELERKLGQRQFDESEIAEVCDRLEGEGLLDDLAAARQLAAGPLARKGYGPLRIRAELQRRGAPEGVVDRVVDEAFGDGMLERARGVALTWLSRRQPDRARLARHLQQKGYPAGTIADVLADEEVRAADRS